jgi:hypothetical protein|tara:strand:- start:1230 stop:1592 length:363 start_codon:yes stop_codon:yes gene_type:complete
VTSKYADKRRLLWVFIALLAYSVQSLAFVGTMDNPASAPADQMMSGCHGDHDKSVKPHSDNTPADCCEDGCTMMGCHTASALVGSLNTPVFNVRQMQSQNVNLGLVAKLSSSLYRPPILR